MNKKIYFVLTLMSLTMCSCAGGSSSSMEPSSSSISSSSSTSISSSITSSSIISSISSSSSIKTTFEVNFNTLGGPTYKSLSYVGQPLSLPTPVYYYHDFLGWFDNPEYQGNKVSQDNYIPTSDVTLYAKWDEVRYLYIYEGPNNDYTRTSYHIGDSVNIDTLPTPKNAFFNGTSCPFTHYTYDGTETTASGVVQITDKDVSLVCNYDKSRVSSKSFLQEYEPGKYIAQGNLNTTLYNGLSNLCYFEADISYIKGRSGGAGIICHALVNDKDYTYEAGSSYISAVISPSNGSLSIQSVANGVYNGLAYVSFSSMPVAFRNLYNDADNEMYFTIHMAVKSETNAMYVYINNDLAYSCTNITSLCQSKSVSYDYSANTFMGFRSSSVYTKFENIHFNDGIKNIKIQKDSSIIDYQYLGGDISGITADEPNYVFANVAFDIEGSDIFNYKRSNEIYEGMTLYACNKRMYSNPNLTHISGNEYKATGNCSALIGVSKDNNLTITMNLQVKKATTSVGATGIIVHALMDQDLTFENASKYIMIQLSGNGSMQVATNDHGSFAHIAGSDYVGDKTLSKLPASWKDAYNSAAVGNLITATIKCVVTNEKITIYLNNTYVGETNNTTLVGGYTGLGYGVRINNAQVGQSFTYDVE